MFGSPYVLYAHRGTWWAVHTPQLFDIVNVQIAICGMNPHMGFDVCKWDQIMTKITKLTKDEKATVSRVVDGKVVSIQHTVKPNRESDIRYQLRWKFDFSNVPNDAILVLASRAVLITKQQEWRAAKDADRMNAEKWDNQVFDVEEMLNTARKTREPVTVEKLAEKMNADEIAATIKLLQSQLKG